MERLDVNAATWWTFMSVTLQGAVHLGKDYSYVPPGISPCDNWNSNWETDHGSDGNYEYSRDRLAAADMAKDNLAYWQGSSVRDCKNLSFPIQCCVWEASVQIQSEHGRTRLIGSCNHVNLEDSIESTGSRWSLSEIFSTGFTTLGILAEIQKMMFDINCEPEQFQGRIIFMSMFYDIEWEKRGNR